MKKVLIALVFLIVSLTVNAQEVYTSTIASGDTLGTIFKLGQEEFIIAVSSSSAGLDGETLQFYVFRGDTLGTGSNTLATTDLLKAQGWKLLSDGDDGSSIYSVTLAQYVETPCSYPVMSHVVGRSRSYGKNQIYILPIISTAASAASTLNIFTQKWHQ